jgi:hypothetical protein
MRDLRRCWTNRPTINCSVVALCAAALLAACENGNEPPEVPLPESNFQVSNDDHSPNANPFTFVGREDQCDPEGGYPAGSRIVSAAWLGGMGLPDNGGTNTVSATDPREAQNKDDAHYGLLLSKNGNSAICASAGATIVGVKGMVIQADFALGFDYRNGTHCGSGAPRFNLVTKDPVTNQQAFHFVGGCANGTKEMADQDPLEWTQVRIALANPAQTFPPVTPGSTILSLSILYDEGTENPGTIEDPRGVGLSVVDNIFINGQYIRSGGGIAFGAGGLEKKDSDGDGLTDDTDTDDDNDAIEDIIDTDDNGDGIEDVLELKLMLPVLELPKI